MRQFCNRASIYWISVFSVNSCSKVASGSLHLHFAVSPCPCTLPGQGCFSQPRAGSRPADVTYRHKEVLMSGQHFRFLHAGGFLLDQPLAGLTEIPEPLTDLLIDAPFSAAQKVFDAAIEERVDFAVLNGDLVDLARPSARAI